MHKSVYTNSPAAEYSALKKINKSAITDKINQADHDRDHTYSGMHHAVKAALYHFDDNIAEAAKRIDVVIHTYGNVNKKSLNEQTSAVYNLVTDLRQNELQNDVAALRIAEWIDELDRRNNIVEALMKERLDEAAHKTDAVMKDARANTDYAYKAICKRINALAEIEALEVFSNYIRKLNLIIDKYNKLLAHAGKKHSHKKEGGAL